MPQQPEPLNMRPNPWSTGHATAGHAYPSFERPKKIAAREAAWPGQTWSYLLVHAVVREPTELKAIAARGVRLVPLHEVLKSLEHVASTGIRASAGTDFSEIIEYFKNHSSAIAA